MLIDESVRDLKIDDLGSFKREAPTLSRSEGVW